MSARLFLTLAVAAGRLLAAKPPPATSVEQFVKPSAYGDKTVSLIAMALLLGVLGSASSAASSDFPILTPKPPRQPSINGPTVYGARPGHPFLYRIPCTGERPMRFTAHALPNGLSLDAATGIITGITRPVRGMIPTTSRSAGWDFRKARTSRCLARARSPRTTNTPTCRFGV